MASRLGSGFRANPSDLLRAMLFWDEHKPSWAMDYHSGGSASRMHE